MREEAHNSSLIDLNTGKKIPRVIWANDETGRYRQILVDENGKYLLNPDKTEILSKVFKGRIKIVRKGAY
jgi:hypothetical protein